MSRPFSYNDENFTVIGNILFVHFNDTVQREKNEPVLDVPPAILKRMVSFTNFVVASLDSNSSASEYRSIRIDSSGHLSFVAQRSATDSKIRMHYCIFLLKDI